MIEEILSKEPMFVTTKCKYELDCGWCDKFGRRCDKYELYESIHINAKGEENE